MADRGACCLGEPRIEEIVTTFIGHSVDLAFRIVTAQIKREAFLSTVIRVEKEPWGVGAPVQHPIRQETIVMTTVSYMTEVPAVEKIEGITYAATEQQKSYTRSRRSKGDVIAPVTVVLCIYLYFTG